MCGQRSSVTTIPSGVQATSRSRSASVTRRIVPGPISAIAATSTKGAARVPGSPQLARYVRDTSLRAAPAAGWAIPKPSPVARPSGVRGDQIGKIVGSHGEHGGVDEVVVPVERPVADQTFVAESGLLRNGL